MMSGANDGKGGGDERTTTAILPWADANGAATRARVMSLLNMVLAMSVILLQAG